MAQENSIKRTLITKANSTIVAITAGACFVVVFSIVASTTLVKQLSYQIRVIDAKKTALHNLKTDIAAVDTLAKSYQAFTGTTQNTIGGDPNGQGGQDGNNAKIIIDALPSSYDFPALATSLEKILTNQGVVIQSIGGIDDALSQINNQSSSKPSSQPMPFNLTVAGNYDSMRKVVTAFERSIRPIQVQTITFSGSQDKLTMAVTAQTYFQPAKNLDIKTEVVK
jgi:hypothetical protein